MNFAVLRSDDDDVALEQELSAGYLRFLQAKDEHKRTEGTRLAKRTKKAKVWLGRRH